MKCDCINRFLYIIALIFIVLAGVYIQLPYMKEFPSFIHAWSQSDRYAIALGFVNNDLDLFHPETFIYNKQFPNWWKCAYDNTVTSVDFPFVEYLVAIVMKITGITSPWIFRIITFMIALTGMFFLFKLTFQITKDWIKSLLITAFAMTSPVYAYYFNGFIPGIPALTFVIISLHFYVKYFENDSNKSFVLSMFFITLSVLIRSSFAVIYVAMLSFESLRILRKESAFKNKIVPVFTSMLFILAYYFWNKHIAAQYGTLFLSELMPADDWSDFWNIMSKTKDNWKFHYFGKIHYYSFIVISLIAFAFACVKKFKDIENKDNSRKKTLSLVFLILIMIFGYFLFTIAMAKQFPNHDYYFIDTYFLPLLLLFTMIIKILPVIVSDFKFLVPLMISFVLIFFMLKNVNEMQQKRRARYWGKASERTIENYQGSEEFLNSVNVSKDAKILTLYSYPQNTPFILMNRKGFTAMHDKDSIMETALSFDYDYVMVENEILVEKQKERSELFSNLKYVSDNGKLTLFVKKY